MEKLEIEGSVLGDHEFTDEEQAWIYEISVFLRNRESIYCPGREDMGLYARTAASIYQLAKTLHGVSINSRFPMKSMDDWLRVITGKSFDFILPEAPKEASSYEKRVLAAGGEVTKTKEISSGAMVTIDASITEEDDAKKG